MTGPATAFTVFHSECRPLSVELAKRASDAPGSEGRSLSDMLSRVETSGQLAAFEAELPTIFDSLRALTPRLHAPVYWSPRTARSGPEPTNRFVVEVPFVGDHHLIQYWPDKVDDCPEPVNAAVEERIKGIDGSLSRTDHREQSDAANMWTIRARSRHAGGDGWSLFTTLDFTDEQLRDLGEGELDSRIQSRVKHIDRIVDKIAEQIAGYVDRELPEELAPRLSRKREILGTRERLYEALTIPDGWEARALSLEEGPDEPVEAADLPSAPAASAGQTPVAEKTGEITVNARSRLAPTSFEQVIRIVRVWADAVESYPAAFAALSEDRLSDLLAATLNATLPGAGREVYSKQGKTDIYISADKLAEGEGPAKVFICEAKKNVSPQGAAKAVNPQLRGYLNVNHTAAALILFMDNQNFKTALAARLSALRKVTGYVEDDGSVSGWPVLVFQWDDRRVRLCVISIHIPGRNRPTAE